MVSQIKLINRDIVIILETTRDLRSVGEAEGLNELRHALLLKGMGQHSLEGLVDVEVELHILISWVDALQVVLEVLSLLLLPLTDPIELKALLQIIKLLSHDA